VKPSVAAAVGNDGAGSVALRGVAAAPGIARGHWARVERPPLPSAGHIEARQADDEIARLKAAAEAVAVASDDLASRVREAGHPDEAEIFGAHAAMARDPELVDSAATQIRERGIDAVGAITAAAAVIAEMLRGLDDELLRGRAADVTDVGDRIARQVAGLPTGEVGLSGPAIVVGDDLPPSLTATLPRDRLLGLALEGSSPTAHASILARAYGIPAVVGTAGLLEALAERGPLVELAIDGSTGEVVIAPDPADVAAFDSRADRSRRDRERDLLDASLLVVTRDGTEVTLQANIGSHTESAAAVALGAHGVGLFRTEFLFLERSAPPSEDEQADAYGSAAEAFAPHPVTIRLLDVGGDKPIPYVPIAHEDNPFLGVRAIRLAESQPDLFVTQLRACYRAASRGRVKVMAAMVADAGDAATFRSLAERARAEVADTGQAAGDIELGVMLEIPSAILTAETYFESLSFASLGTNDLLQYSLAIDRGNPGLERYRDSLHPALLRLIAQAVEAAARFDVELSVCGEMAGDPVAALALVGLGVRSLSMAAPSLPAVRRAIRAAERSALESAARAALGDRSAAEARARFTEPAAAANE
jgi:phosphoenolpyruvate-protein phosphotransferase (PTS system enzyme I)